MKQNKFIRNISSPYSNGNIRFVIEKRNRKKLFNLEIDRVAQATPIEPDD